MYVLQVRFDPGLARGASLNNGGAASLDLKRALEVVPGPEAQQG